MRAGAGAMGDAATTTAPERARGIDRTIDLLEALLRRRSPARIGELARSIGAPRSTTYEIVRRLAASEILQMSGNGEVYFGRAVHFFGRAYEAANPLYRRARPVLDRLATETGETAQLCALKGDKYVVMEARDGGRLFRITMDVGIEVPLPWTASGRFLLDHMSPEEIRAFVPLEDFRLPDGGLVEFDDFIAAIKAAREAGRCMTTGLADRFTWCLAAPIRGRDGVAAATLCFMVPIDTSQEERTALLDRLVTAAEKLSVPEAEPE